MLNKLNGWRRLWLVATVVFGIYMLQSLLFEAYPKLPTAEKIERTYQSNLKSLQNYTDPEDIAWWKNHYQGIRKTELENMPFDRVVMIGAPLVIWIGGSLLVYSIGWVVAWVIRGFRKQSA